MTLRNLFLGGDPCGRVLSARVRTVTLKSATSDPIDPPVPLPRKADRGAGPRRVLAAAFACLMLATVLAGCGGDASDGGALRSSLGKGEGQLALLAWPGLVENGSTDPDINWVESFERDTGCKVTVKTAESAERMRELVRTNAYDGVSASGELSRQLMADGVVAPVNTKLISNYSDVVPGLRNKAWNSLDGQAYGVPQGRTAQLLTYRPDAVTPAPTSLNALYDSSASYKGKVMVPDSALSFADAAILLRATKPELKITNPYALNRTQFTAALDLIRAQTEIANLYWIDYVQQVEALETKKSVIGLASEAVASLVNQRGAKVSTAFPTEGTTGSSDTWMLTKKAAHPSCMYRWMNYVLDAKVNAQVAEYYGVAPSVAKACEFTADKGHCDALHATDEEYYSKVWIATTPMRDCVTGGGSCVEYRDWQRAWEQVRS